MEKRLPVALRALARFKSAKKGRRDAEDAETRRLATQNEAVLRFMHLRGIQYILGALHAHL